MSDAVLELFMAIYNTHANHKKCKNVISIYFFIINARKSIEIAQSFGRFAFRLCTIKFDY